MEANPALLEECLAKANVKFYIHSAFQLLMWIVVVFNLLSTVL